MRRVTRTTVTVPLTADLQMATEILCVGAYEYEKYSCSVCRKEHMLPACPMGALAGASAFRAGQEAHFIRPIWYESPVY